MRALGLLLCLALTGCSVFLFHPDRNLHLTPDKLGLEYENVHLVAADGARLHGWLLLTRQKARGIVLFLHGNAENISTHIRNVAWLPEHGYQVFLPDYRGYGMSEGNPTLAGALSDEDAAFRWLAEAPRFQHLPIYLLGQSLGATLAAYYVGANPEVRKRLSALVLDAPLASYRRIAREKFAAFWPTWPLQYPLSLLFPDDYSPIHNVARIAPVPLLVICSENDGIIPVHHSLELYQAAGEPKQLLVTRGAHTATFLDTENRRWLLEFLRQNRRND